MYNYVIRTYIVTYTIRTLYLNVYKLVNYNIHGETIILQYSSTSMIIAVSIMYLTIT